LIIYKDVVMSKTIIVLCVAFCAFILSGCTSTVRNTNYTLYKSRLKAQSYLTGKHYNVRPMVSGHGGRSRVNSALPIRRVSNQPQRYCPPSKKVIRRPAYTAKKVVRKPLQRPVVRRVYAVIKKRPIRVSKRLVVQKIRGVAHPAKPKRLAVRLPAIKPRAMTPRLPLNQLNDGLFNAAKAGNIIRVKVLLSQGAQINAANSSKETALHAASALGRSSTVSLLLQKGANPNAKTSGGWTPLHSAARFRHTQAARLLVAEGSQINARNHQGKTPVALAKHVGASATATALMALGGRK
jgi:hypothetical protein